MLLYFCRTIILQSLVHTFTGSICPLTWWGSSCWENLIAEVTRPFHLQPGRIQASAGKEGAQLWVPNMDCSSDGVWVHVYWTYFGFSEGKWFSGFHELYRPKNQNVLGHWNFEVWEGSREGARVGWAPTWIPVWIMIRFRLDIWKCAL